MKKAQNFYHSGKDNYQGCQILALGTGIKLRELKIFVGFLEWLTGFESGELNWLIGFFWLA